MCDDYEITVDLDEDVLDVVVDIPEISFLQPGPSAGVFSPVESFSLISDDETQGWDYLIDGNDQFFIVPQTGVISGAKSLDLKSDDGHLWQRKPNGNGIMVPVDMGYVGGYPTFIALFDIDAQEIVLVGVDGNGMFTKRRL